MAVLIQNIVSDDIFFRRGKIGRRGLRGQGFFTVLGIIVAGQVIDMDSGLEVVAENAEADVIPLVFDAPSLHDQSVTDQVLSGKYRGDPVA
ncbi:MAG: hypothetical protein IIY77_03245, partial [Lachnospiraceae bacterium]|nr:hypothetical protein [Lachnospiraceae bacterium]